MIVAMNKAPLTIAADQLAAATGAIVDHSKAQGWADLDPKDCLTFLDGLRRCIDRLETCYGMMINQATTAGVPNRAGFPTMEIALERTSHICGKDTRRRSNQAATLGGAPSIENAMLEGRLNQTQAFGAAKATQLAKKQLDPAVHAQVEDYAAQTAAKSSFVAPSKLAEELVSRFDPATSGVEQSAEAAQRQAERAKRARYIAFNNDGAGSIIFRGSLPLLEGMAFQRLVIAYGEKARANNSHTPSHNQPSAGERFGGTGVGSVTGDAGRVAASTSGASRTVVAGEVDRAAGMGGRYSLRAVEQGQFAGRGALLADGLVAMVGDVQRAKCGPLLGGDRPRLNITISLDQLKAAVEQHLPATGVGPDGDTLTATELRKLACDCEVLPIVLGGAGEVLDVGRSGRTIPAGIRRALDERDGGCCFPGCDRPVEQCQAHHVIPWAKGGHTRLSNLMLLCAHHHGVVEPVYVKTPSGECAPDPNRWTADMGGDGYPVIIPSARYDPERKPITHDRIKTRINLHQAKHPAHPPPTG
jgi:hypothetical protein